MSDTVYEGILEGLRQALAYERGEIRLQNKTIGHCPTCGHHLNFSEGHVAYCPVCDKEYTRDDCH